MSDNLIQVKAFLGKYYAELNYSAIQEKYRNTQLDTIFEQRFYIQNNKAQMIVDPGMTGLVAIFTGNEVHISKELYDHPSVIISNSLENKDQASNPRNLYNADTFSTVAYLVCQNHTMFHIVGDVDEPIYLKYKSDYETFHNSVIVVEVAIGVEVEIVEEVESLCALNVVTNYVLQPTSRLNLTTFYQNRVSALSYFYRNIVSLEDSKFNHLVFGKGSSNIIDENKIQPHHNSKSEFLGIINGAGMNFHSILCIHPGSNEYSVNVDYRDLLSGDSDVTFYPVIIGQEPTSSSSISVSNISLDEIVDNRDEEIKKYIGDILDRGVLERMAGVKRFYDNKTKFLLFP